MSGVVEMLADLVPSGAVMIIVAAVVGLAAIQLIDARRKSSPKARVAQRLSDLLSNGSTARARPEATSDTAEAHLFRVDHAGLRGAIETRFADLSANIGGARVALALLTVSFVVGIVAATAIRALLAPPPGLDALGGLAVGAFFFLAGQSELRRRWMIAFSDQLVEAVEMLSRSVRSGYAVPAAVRLVGVEVRGPVGDVFARIADEEDLGIDIRQALGGAARRVSLPDFNFLTVALLLQRETGGQLGDALDNLHVVLRKRKEARLKIRAVTAEARTSALIVTAIPFVSGGAMYMLDPEKIGMLFESDFGRKMLMVAGGLLVTGVLIIRQMVKPRA